MAAESATDRAAFFNPDEFGVTATYAPTWGDRVTINGIFESPHQGVDFGGDVQVSSTAPTFRCLSTDLPAGFSQHDVVTISGADDPADDGDYTAADFQPDGTGHTILELERVC